MTAMVKSSGKTSGISVDLAAAIRSYCDRQQSQSRRTDQLESYRCDDADDKNESGTVSTSIRAHNIIRSHDEVLGQRQAIGERPPPLRRKRSGASTRTARVGVTSSSDDVVFDTTADEERSHIFHGREEHNQNASMPSSSSKNASCHRLRHHSESLQEKISLINSERQLLSLIAKDENSPSSLTRGRMKSFIANDENEADESFPKKEDKEKYNVKDMDDTAMFFPRFKTSSVRNDIPVNGFSSPTRKTSKSFNVDDENNNSTTNHLEAAKKYINSFHSSNDENNNVGAATSNGFKVNHLGTANDVSYGRKNNPLISKSYSPKEDNLIQKQGGILENDTIDNTKNPIRLPPPFCTKRTSAKDPPNRGNEVPSASSKTFRRSMSLNNHDHDIKRGNEMIANNNSCNAPLCQEELVPIESSSKQTFINREKKTVRYPAPPPRKSKSFIQPSPANHANDGKKGPSAPSSALFRRRSMAANRSRHEKVGDISTVANNTTNNNDNCDTLLCQDIVPPKERNSFEQVQVSLHYEMGNETSVNDKINLGHYAALPPPPFYRPPPPPPRKSGSFIQEDGWGKYLEGAVPNTLRSKTGHSTDPNNGQGVHKNRCHGGPNDDISSPVALTKNNPNTTVTERRRSRSVNRVNRQRGNFSPFLSRRTSSTTKLRSPITNADESKSPVQDSDQIYLSRKEKATPLQRMPKFEKTHGRCIQHPSVVIAQKKNFQKGGWTIIRDRCPLCGDITDENDTVNKEEGSRGRSRSRSARVRDFATSAISRVRSRSKSIGASIERVQLHDANKCQEAIGMNGRSTQSKRHGMNVKSITDGPSLRFKEAFMGGIKPSKQRPFTTPPNESRPRSNSIGCDQFNPIDDHGATPVITDDTDNRRKKHQFGLNASNNNNASIPYRRSNSALPERSTMVRSNGSEYSPKPPTSSPGYRSRIVGGSPNEELFNRLETSPIQKTDPSFKNNNHGTSVAMKMQESRPIVHNMPYTTPWISGIYSGEVNKENGTPSGKGKLVFDNGSEHNGVWNNGYPEEFEFL